MPNRDKTGPEGKGPKTGRQMGNCEETKPQQGLGRGRNLVRGRSLGRGRGLRKPRNRRARE